MQKYIWQHSTWPNLIWDELALNALLTECRQKQSYLLGAANMLSFDLKLQAQGVILEKEVLETSAIEGELLDPAGIRLSVARKLGLPDASMRTSDRKTDAVVDVVLDAANHFDKHLSVERLKGWHAALFSDGYSGFHKIVAGEWRTEEMEIISGPEGRQKVHYRAPSPTSITAEMNLFMQWLNNNEETNMDGLVRAGLAHYRFAAIHPFEDGNGRIARALTDMALAQDEGISTRFYTLSHQIMKERDDYYAVLEKCSNGSGDITPWQEWFLGCFQRAVVGSQGLINSVLAKARFWQEFSATELNMRQKKVINKLLDAGKGNFEGNLAAKNYRTIAKTTKASASRDLDDLLKKGVLRLAGGGGRSTRYDLVWEKFE